VDEHGNTAPAITEQINIGWLQLFYGRFSQDFIYAHDEWTSYLQLDEKTNNGSTWLTRLTILIWRYALWTWKHRCETLHQTTQERNSQRIEDLT
jgi:hypothetical protein